MAAEKDNVTALLQAWGAGDSAAGDRLVPLVYEELRRQAARFLRRERREHTLPATGLVHEVYLRLAGEDMQWENRLQFFGVAGRLMRRVLVDHARKHGTSKRGGDWARVSLSKAEALTATSDRSLDLMALDRALDELGQLDPRKERLVELHFFAGLTLAEAAQALGVSESTTTRDWRLARAWLRSRLSAGADAPRPPATPWPQRSSGS